MKLNELTQIAEVISGIAVVITLVLLIFEIRDNTEATISANTQETLRASRDAALELATTPALASIIEKGRTNQELTPEESLRLASWVRAMLRNYEAIYLLYQSGELDESLLEVYESRMAGFMGTNPLSREQLQGRGYSEAFRDWALSVDSRLN